MNRLVPIFPIKLE